MLKKVLDFLFGKDPDIFDKEGRVSHQISKDRWDKWQRRYTHGEEYNWKNHSGMKASQKQ